MNRIEVRVLALFVLIFLAIVLYTGARIISETVKGREPVDLTVVITRKTIPAVIEGREFLLEVADTPKSRERGLSIREPLCANCGMLFVFDHPGTYSIWMKNMFFPIDVLWLDENKKVIHIVDNMSPESFPQTFTSESPARYILEIQSGARRDLELEIGSEIEFDLSNLSN